MKRHLKLLLSVILLLCSFALGAQELTVKSFTVATTDLSASSNQRLDLNGHPCGLVKVQLAVAGAQFEGNVITPTEHKVSEYWVYMTEGSKELKINAPGFLPLHINFDDHQISGVVPKTTYVLTLAMPGVQRPVDDGMQYLMMQVEPTSSQVFVDGVQQELVNGEMSVRLPKGSHRYRVEAFGYETKEGEVTLGAQKGEPLKVTLQSKMAKVTISCATTGAQIYVNDQLRGTSPWQGQLAAGSYVVESRLTGYHAQRQDISLSWHESRDIVIPELVAITGNLNVDYKPLGAEIWIDGRKAGASPDMLRDVPVGTHHIEIRKDGYQTKKETVMISEGQTASISGVLASASSANVSSSPSGSNIETFTVNGVTFKMIKVEGGTFQMGSNSGDSDEKPVHQVTLTNDYYIGETEVTQALWKAVMESEPTANGGWKKKDGRGDRYPAYNVSWDDCQTFINKLNALTGKTFRLPTEAEWEFAARGGNKSKGYTYSGSNTIGDVAWYYDNSSSKTHEVGMKSPNELGIYDMSGNVWEWCLDWYGSYSSYAQTNPTGPTSGSNRVVRGGGRDGGGNGCRVALRSWYNPSITYCYLGLRLVF